MLRELSENEIVIKLIKGEQKAFDKLYWKYHSALFFNVLKLTKDLALAEDILQEVFITLWEKRHTLKEESSIAGWLFMVSYNKSVDAMKKQVRETNLIKSLNFEPSELEIDQKKQQELQHTLISKALQQLSPQKLKVFQLCKIEGKTYQQAAAELKLSKHTVKEYLSDAVILVKKFIHDHPEGNSQFKTLLLISLFFLAG